MRRSIGILVAVAAGSLAAHADEVVLGQPAYGGTGCPAGTVSAILSQDATSLSFTFDAYQAMAGGLTGLSVDRKTCSIDFPVHVPQGLSVSVPNIEYRIHNTLPAGSASQFSFEYFFAGAPGPRVSETFNGVLDDYANVLAANRATENDIVWSTCGADLHLRSTSSVRVSTSQNREALATISAVMVYQPQSRACP